MHMVNVAGVRTNQQRQYWCNKTSKKNATIKPYDINSVQNDWVDIPHKWSTALLPTVHTHTVLWLTVLTVNTDVISQVLK